MIVTRDVIIHLTKIMNCARTEKRIIGTYTTSTIIIVLGNIKSTSYHYKSSRIPR